ncbi:DUF2239 family protein [Deinococcus apachensis]|uniref:DUF2239 family protein n=1 Tax=Deinococcus apachensis TaxID=309886 RepID=UPI0003795ADB|nr:DUF2239 family protein [Deinococcus apachensis]
MEEHFTVFVGDRHLISGPLREVLAQVKAREETSERPLLIFNHTGNPVDFDLRGPLDEVIARVQPPRKPAGRGRPRLGVVAREVTLLPRHWDWLEAQPGGASAALRRLVDEARKRDPGREGVLAAQTAADRFLGVMAGDRPGYQEASRALYARDRVAFEAHMAGWPPDIRTHALNLAAPAFEEVPATPTP